MSWTKEMQAAVDAESRCHAQGEARRARERRREASFAGPTVAFADDGIEATCREAAKILGELQDEHEQTARRVRAAGGRPPRLNSDDHARIAQVSLDLLREVPAEATFGAASVLMHNLRAEIVAMRAGVPAAVAFSDDPDKVDPAELERLRNLNPTLRALRASRQAGGGGPRPAA